MAEHNLEDKIDAGFRGVNARIEALDKSVNGRIDTLDAGFRGVNGRIDTLDAGFRGVNARLDTLDTGFADLRTDVGELKAYVFEVRDALFADNVKTREFVRIEVETLRTDLKVYEDGVIAHTEKLGNQEKRITKLESR